MNNTNNKAHMKIGYALGGGAARGLAHIGVLKVLEEYGINPDIIAGTSIGAIIGALYAGGYKANDIEQLVLGLDWKKMMSLADISLPLGGLIRGSRVVALLRSILGDLSFPQLKYSYACATTDVLTGEQVILRDGSLIDAIHASISLPGIFRPVMIKGRYLVDGGLLNEVPVSICRQMGADYVIGVNVIPDPGKVICSSNSLDTRVCRPLESVNGFVAPTDEHSLSLMSRLAGIENAVKNFVQSHQPRIQENKLKLIHSGRKNIPTKTKPRPPTLWEVLRQSMAITQYHVAVENIKSANLVISPVVGEIGFWQFNKASEAIAAGENATRLAIQQKELTDPLLKVADR